MNLLRSLLAALLLAAALNTHAGIEIQKFDDPEKQAAYKSLVAELRCLVCQNQNLADSNAELAVDLRNEVFKMLETGSTQQEVVDFMVARYGDFVLYRPPVQSNTIVLWVGPFLILIIALILAFFLVRRQLINNKSNDDDAEEESV